MSSGPSVAEFPAYSPIGAVDEDTLRSFALALRLHEGRYRKIPRVIPVATPVAGADPAAQQVPSGTVWWLQSIFAVYTASAAVANRVPFVSYDDSTTTYLRIPTPVAITASQAIRASWIRGMADHLSASTSAWFVGLPSIPLPGGFRLSLTTTNIDVGDQWSSIALHVIEVSESQLSERAQLTDDLVSGAHADLYPGLELGS